MNHTMSQILTMGVNELRISWDEDLPYVQFQ